MNRMCLNLILTGLMLSMSLASAIVQTPPKDGQTEDKKPAASRPGKDRWLVKTASDADAKTVNQRPVKSTVEKLLGIPRPTDLPIGETPAAYQEKRVKPVETTVYTVEADIVECRLMPDGDYRVTIRGASGQTLVLEMPDPDPAFVSPNSPFAYAIKSAREQFETKFKPERTAKPIIAHAKVTGIGFFGRAFNKQSEVKGNLVQLHPVLQIEWMEKPSDEWQKATPKTPPPTSP